MIKLCQAARAIKVLMSEGLVYTVRGWAPSVQGGSSPRGSGQEAADGSEHWAGQYTGYVSHDVEVTGRDAAVGGPWLGVELPPGTEVTLTLRRRLRVRVPAARTPWDTAPWDAAQEG
jgi:hypothetical protein